MCTEGGTGAEGGIDFGASGNSRDGARLPADANPCAPAVPAYRLIQSLRLIVGYKLLACLLANTELTDDVPVAVRIVRLEIVQ